MINLNSVAVRTLACSRRVASSVMLTICLAGGAALAAPVAPPATGGDISTGKTAVAADNAQTGAQDTNPFKGNEEKAAAGKKIFIGYGCVGCHGQSGGGGMGPSLIDSDWRYGGKDADLFHSIHDGRPKGMPAWSSHLTDEQIWEVITFLRSISIAG